jgi:ankyrin repeat protein
MNRANTYEEIALLVDYCKKGKLFEARDWIAQGKPIDLPLTLPPKQQKRSPLHIAMELGFYSLIQILVENGASMEEPRYSALQHALEKRRLDIVQLLVKNGAQIASVDLEMVFDTWDKEIMIFFIENGADCQTNCPLAYAFRSKIRTALSIYMQYKDRFPHFQEQIDMALRYHCREGNLKWVALLLWAGANPYAKGPEDPGDSPEEYSSALEVAAFNGHFKIFKLKSIHLDPKSPAAHDLLRHACYSDSADILIELLKMDFDPRELPDKGTSSIESLLNMMTWDYSNYFTRKRNESNIDSYRSRDKMKMLHLLVRHGARWEPDEDNLKYARRSLLRMNPHYPMEFAWIMTEYKACRFEILEKLMNTKTMLVLIAPHRRRFDEMINSFRIADCQLSG